jgi:hypothetical protein
MGMGPIIWTCLALTIHQGAVQEYFMNDRAFRIPIKLDAKRSGDIKTLILLFSQDKGRAWQPVDRKTPTEREFIFRAPDDGSYWFIIQEEDRSGRTNPSNPERVKPHMAVIVDTTRPQIKVTAERLPGGEIRAHWKAADSYPDVRSLRLDYHSGAHPESGWTPVALPTTLEGEQKFACKDAGGEVRVRLRMKDQAGNEGEDVFVLPAAATSAAVPPPEGSAIGLIPTTPSDPSSQPNRLTSQQTQRPIIEVPPGTMPAPSPPVVEMSAPTPSPPAPGGLPIAADPGGQASRLSPDGIGETPANSSAVRIVRSREVRIDFTVGKVGPSGLGNAIIYVTLDQGRSWKAMPGEVPISLPPGGDSHGPEVSGSVSVQLPAEGIIYGFIVAVKSKAGLALPPPKPGDPPQALVEWDKTPPTGQLFKPQPDPSQSNTLVLAWEVKDRNLAEKPITLEWAEHKDGSWTPISEAPLSNTPSQYSWHLPDRLPPRVYLRLTMRDQAGNESRAQTDTPVLIDLSVPQTRITGIAPASR